MLASPDDSTRMTAAGCLGTLCAALPDAELSDLMIQHLLGKSLQDDEMSVSENVIHLVGNMHIRSGTQVV